MNYIIKGYEPEKVFHFFEEISAIPRSSGNEKEISDYLVSFAKAHGYEYYQDAICNVVIRKPASEGFDGLPAIAFQGHIDMVCEKNIGTVHDFSRDPLKLAVKDGKLFAKGTTLGADNGIAVAMMLALLDDESIKHPALECIFTVMEETGLTGAAELDKRQVTAQYMINLDAEDEGIATVSCCGGIRTHLKRAVNFEPVKGNCMAISLGGLAGGHSGMDIDKGRANANKLMAQVLSCVAERFPLRLIRVDGGNMDNAIPRECCAVIAASAALSEIMKIVEDVRLSIAKTLHSDDSGFALSVKPCSTTEMLTAEASNNILMLMNAVPHGVLARGEENFIESSTNFASIHTTENCVECIFLTRSVVEDKKHEIVASIEQTAGALGFSASHSGDYPGWAYDAHSHLRELASKSYRELFSKELRLNAIHAGLECGLFKAKQPSLDILAIGPNIAEVHTPNERLDLDSCRRIWQLILSILDKLCA
ncbi:aminoacyl-histidine dipeptidase [Acetanaerobacterium elongatum]|uniref:Cytosol non-specific dipeptidase n=1 Tax=Acetanaerobacterium elongatum TaxID=258515 RepID=A0A1H0A5U9_9FIRM|nr:aminoacyl-histidine dipeptidase [Acetanaerobacterium elongatum]SDN28353.1 dipeptidase D [Acetanaerobacterium elongatum]